MVAHGVELRWLIDERVVDPPRIENRFREDEARVAGDRLLTQVAAVSDDARDRELPVVKHVAQRVTGLEETGALNHHEWYCTAKVKPSGDAPCFPFSTDTHESQTRLPLERVVPLAECTVRHRHHVSDAQLDKNRCDLFA